LENKREEQVLPRSRGRERGQVAQIICTHVCKCKNDKIQLKKKDSTQRNDIPISLMNIDAKILNKIFYN
jgi:hypothetical protein